MQALHPLQNQSSDLTHPVSNPVINPASPSIDFSINALQGQTVTHCPQLTQDESLILTPLSQITRGRSKVPIN